MGPLSQFRTVAGWCPSTGSRGPAMCKGERGRAMETSYVSYQPPRVCPVRMTQGPWIFARFVASWRFEPITADQTRALFTYHIQARRGQRPTSIDPLPGCPLYNVPPIGSSSEKKLTNGFTYSSQARDHRLSWLRTMGGMPELTRQPQRYLAGCSHRS
jgi:hypothetical protein